MHNRAASDWFTDEDKRTICSDCYNDFDSKEPDPSLARSLSTRNGFGHIPRPVFNDPDYELYTLLGVATMVEEAAVRQITPLVLLTRLKHGNLGTKGNTSCVWQSNTQLQLLLPNLPSEVGHIYLSYRRGGGNDSNPELSSHRFEH
jgi:hypothetical protein